ncbi:MAG: hypothetical protein QM690_20875 [Sphingobium sp.]
MNMISSIGTGGLSPRAMMDKRIDSAVQSGSISETDEAALETALDAIDSALGIGSAGSGSAPTNRLDPSQMGDRIDDLIEEQVKAGTLTEDQAATLQTLFAQNAPPQGTGNGEGPEEFSLDGVDGTRPNGPPPPPPSFASASGTDEESGTTSEADQARQLDALIAFLNNMREKMVSGTVYGASASSSTSDSSLSGLVVDSYA